jgi:hypothetical protein
MELWFYDRTSTGNNHKAFLILKNFSFVRLEILIQILWICLMFKILDFFNNGNTKTRIRISICTYKKFVKSREPKINGSCSVSRTPHFREKKINSVPGTVPYNTGSLSPLLPVSNIGTNTVPYRYVMNIPPWRFHVVSTGTGIAIGTWFFLLQTTPVSA